MMGQSCTSLLCENLKEPCQHPKNLHDLRVAENTGLSGSVGDLNGTLLRWHKDEQLQDPHQGADYFCLETLLSLLQECIKNKDILAGRHMHSLIFLSDFESNIKVGCLLIRMYTSCGSMLDAIKVFRSLPEQNVFTWSAIILGHAQNRQGKEAIMLYQEMGRSGVAPNSYTFVAVLKACADLETLDYGKEIHVHIVGHGLESDLHVGSTLIDMYAKCGSLENACRVFDKLPERDLVTWSTMIAGYTEHGHGHEALQLFERMRLEGREPDKVIFVYVLKACAIVPDQDKGKLIHDFIRKCRLESHRDIGIALIYMYSKCGNLYDARKVFDGLREPEVGSWNAMIRGYADHGQGDEAIGLLKKMLQKGTEPNKFTYVCILKGCTTIGALDQGKLIHSQIRQKGLESDLLVGSSLIDMYAKSGNLAEARKVFDKLRERDVVAWSMMVARYAENGLGQEALQLYKSMQEDGIEPNKVTFAGIVKACASIGRLDQGKLIHRDIKKCGLELDLFVGSSLIDMYAKCGSLEEARKVFDGLPERDVVSWSTMIAGYAELDHGKCALKLFDEMKLEGMEPNDITFVCTLKACASTAALDKGRLLHADIIMGGLERDLYIGNTLISMYAKCGNLENAWKVFYKLPMRDVVSWNAIIEGQVEHGQGKEALLLFENMQLDGVIPDDFTLACVLKACADIPDLNKGMVIYSEVIAYGLESDVFIGSTLVDMHAKSGSLDDARRVFQRLSRRNLVCWSAMIAGYAERGHGQEALQLFEKMQQEGTEPNGVAFACALKACASIAALNQGKLIHAELSKQRLDTDLYLGISLIDMYSKCGSLDDAEKVFNKMPERDVVAWSAMVTAFSQHGHCKIAQWYFEGMQSNGVKPDAVTFVSLLSACSHAGLVKEGQWYFKSMIEDYGLMPTSQHFVCMIDLLGRSGLLNEAEDLVLTMPLLPDSVVWLALLSSCARYKSMELGRRAFDFLLKTDKGNAAGYVQMASIYAANCMWEDSQKIIEMRAREQAENTSEQCWIEVNNTRSVFTAKDRSHHQSDEIYMQLERLQGPQ